MKVYYLTRIELDTFPLIPGKTEHEMSVPPIYTKGSNIISEHEGILLRWLELNFEA